MSNHTMSIEQLTNYRIALLKRNSSLFYWALGVAYNAKLTVARVNYNPEFTLRSTARLMNRELADGYNVRYAKATRLA